MSDIYPFFDGHNDALLRLWINPAQDPAAAFIAGTPDGHLDLPRARQGRLAGGLFALFVPPVSYIAHIRQQTSEAIAAQHQPAQIVREQAAILQAIAAQSHGQATICRTAGEIEQAMHSGALAMVMHLEGGDALDSEGELLDELCAQGLRSLGPFWNLPNRFGKGVNGNFPASPDTGAGLTAEGIALIKTCNQRRILIDVSHMNEKAFWDTARLSDAPLVATHSNAHQLCPQPRNLTDRQLDAIRDSDGLVGVNFGTAFLRADGKRDGKTAVAEIVKHLSYLADRIGIERVALGSDFDGVNVPDALHDVAGLPRLADALAAAGFSAACQQKMAWRNWLRVLKQTWGE